MSESGGKDHWANILRQIRQRISVHAGARRGVELENICSCCAQFRVRRRAEQELRGGEPFNDVHGATADWTDP